MKQCSAIAWTPCAIAFALLALAGPRLAHGQFNVTWQGPNNGQWWEDSNWPPPAGGTEGVEPLAEFAEQAIIDNDTTAVVSRAADTNIDPDEGNPGGVKLGPTAGTSGGLRIVSGGTLTVDAGIYDDGIVITTTDGFVDAGQSGTGTLTVLGGGTLNSVGIRSGGESTSSINLGDSSGLTATVSTGFAELARTTRVVGPNVNFNATNGIQFTGEHTLIAEITHQTNHSALKTPALAQLGGTLRPEFNGVTPQVNDEWTLIDAGFTYGDFDALDLSALPALGPAQAYRIKRDSGGNGDLVKLAVDQLLTLVIDRESGAATITNEGSAAVAIDGYSILSPSGGLTGTWNSLANQGTAGWQEATPTANALNELSDSATLNVTGASPASVGTPYEAVFPAFGVDPDDIEFEFTLDGDVAQGLVEYTGTKVNNNLAIIVDPSTGEVQFKNDSPFDVAIDGYSIYSTSGSLNVDDSNWNSLSDAGITGWREASPVSTVASELNPDGSLLLGGFDAYEFGTLFDSMGTQDLVFEFVMEGEDTPRQGAVVYAEIIELPGDYNEDGKVDIADYTVWRNNLGSAVTLPNEGDGVTPGQVTAEDYAFWKSNFGASASAAAVSTSGVPEPLSLQLLALLAMVGACVCRTKKSALPFSASSVKHRGSALAGLLLAFAVSAPFSQAAVVIDEDFEGETGLPTGWVLVDNNPGTADPSFSILTGHDGSGGDLGQSGHIGDMIDGVPGPGQPTGGWFQAPSTVNASTSWELSFDIKFGFPAEGTADDSAIVFGDLDNRNYYTLVITEVAGNNDLLYLLNDDRQGNTDSGTPVVGTDGFASGLVENTWYSGTLTYDSVMQGLSFQLVDPATDSSLGSFATKLNGTHMVLNSTTAMFETVNPALSGDVQFGFGTLNDNGTYDNIVLETISTAPGDVDGDGVADIDDFNIIRDNFRQSASSRSDGDLTGDGFVDFYDYRQWSETQPGSVVAAVAHTIPEPTTALLLLTAFGLLASCPVARRVHKADT
ncbi:hypothetical protein NG895_12470 [Aeoliella sp. ICT_H6.2]|uniref:PEP-CTERM protein-sorting domain-containing protein n=1 Tax=Aeoliella straminimaris TaxID=2954799 RepID=A0A9X2FAN3_9BACT|nr:hypothetical protein [Aeoliella straminimaris]MCO6044723.1 hypothetical protein [Aeoliella straminimaris]